MRILSNVFLSLILLILSNGFGFSQYKTSAKQEHILIAIEDSLRGRSLFGEDSAWLNEQLQLHNAPFKESKIKYKLVKIGKRKFTEGPHAKYPFTKQKPVVNYKYGDSSFSVLGEKFYTYIGNSSWGYYPEYHLTRVEIEKSYTASMLDSKKLIKLIELSKRDPNTCEHGWDMRRGMACHQCLYNYKMKHDSNYKKVQTLRLNKLNPSRYCKHGFDTHSSGLCVQCQHEEKMKEDSTLMPFYTYYPKKDSLNPNPTPIIMDCNHGHICCETTFCECCPEHLRKKPIPTNSKIQIVGNPVCKHGYDQHLGRACPECQHEYRMSKDSTLKPYADYFPKIDTSVTKTVPLDCDHGHLCCQVNCPCCQEVSSERSKQIMEVLKLSNCAHGHDCCTFNCEYCPTLTKRERRRLIRKKRRIYRRNMRDGRRKGRKARRKR